LVTTGVVDGHKESLKLQHEQNINYEELQKDGTLSKESS
jgi:hypothetical protein